MDCISEDDTRNAAEVEDSLLIADCMKNSIDLDDGSGMSLASIKLLSNIDILW